MTLSFMIKKKYLAEKAEEQKEIGVFHERRAYKPFWRKRIGSTHQWGGDEAVFLCGRYSFRADVLNIVMGITPDGITDIVDGGSCYVIECRFLQSELDGLSLFLA